MGHRSWLIPVENQKDQDSVLSFINTFDGHVELLPTFIEKRGNYYLLVDSDGDSFADELNSHKRRRILLLGEGQTHPDYKPLVWCHPKNIAAKQYHQGLPFVDGQLALKQGKSRVIKAHYMSKYFRLASVHATCDRIDIVEQRRETLRTPWETTETIKEDTKDALKDLFLAMVEYEGRAMIDDTVKRIQEHIQLKE